MSDSTAASREYKVRIPSLFEIFFGKLANWFRQLAKWRKQGLLRKALAARRRRVMRMEQLEPRLLLSADLIYGGDVGDPADALVTDMTLVAENNSGDLFLKLYETGDLTNEIGSIQIDDPAKLDVNIKRFGDDLAASAAGDRLRIDMDSLAALDAYVSGNGDLLKLNFNGGTEVPLVSDDHVNLEGTGSYSLDFGLHIASTSDIIVGFGDLTIGGDFTLVSADEISVSASQIDAGSHDITLTVNASSEGIFGIGVLGLSDANIALQDTVLQGQDIAIKATSTITLTPDSYGGSTVKVATANALSDANVTLSNADITAGGSLTVTAGSVVKATAQIRPNADGGTSETTDAAVAEVFVDSDSSVHVGTGSDLSATGKVHVHAENAVTVATRADAQNAGKGGSVAVSTVIGDTSAFVDGGSKLAGSDVALEASSTRTVATIAISTPGGASDGGGTNKSEQVLADPNDDGDTSDKAATSEGDVQFAGAVAVSVVSGTTEAWDPLESTCRHASLSIL